jgi:probable rRNA maturation factor
MSVRLCGPPPGVDGSRVDGSLLRERARELLRLLGLRRAELSLALVDDAEMARLNRGWRRRRGPTDVLSFSLVGGPYAEHRRGLLGDVVIDVETAARQARRRHRSLDEEAGRLLVHGVLHLLGHDHEREDEARVMRAEERRLWRALRS